MTFSASAGLSSRTTQGTVTAHQEGCSDQLSSSWPILFRQKLVSSEEPEGRDAKGSHSGNNRDFDHQGDLPNDLWSQASSYLVLRGRELDDFPHRFNRLDQRQN